MASSVVRMILKLDDQASGTLKKTEKAATSLQSRSKRLTTGLKMAGGALATIAVGAFAANRAMMMMGQEFARQVNTFNDMSMSTGLAVNTLEDLDLMARVTGVSLKGLERGLVKFQVSLGEAKRGTGTLSKALDQLGLDPGQFDTTDEALRAVLERISQIEDSSEQAMLLQQSFGIAAKDMAKVMVTSFGQAARAQDLLGTRMGEAKQEAMEVQKAIALQELVLEKLKRQIFLTFMGEGGFGDAVGFAVGVMTGLASLIGDIIGALKGVFMVLGVGIAGTMALMVGDVEGARHAAEEMGKELQNVGKSLTGLLTADWAQEGMSASSKFRAALRELNADAEKAAEIQSHLGDETEETSGKMSAQAHEAERLREALDEAHKSWMSYVRGIEHLDITAESGSARFIDGLERAQDALGESESRARKAANAYALLWAGGPDVQSYADRLEMVAREWVRNGKAVRDYADGLTDIAPVYDVRGFQFLAVATVPEVSAALQELGMSATEAEDSARALLDTWIEWVKLSEAGDLDSVIGDTSKLEDQWESFARAILFATGYQEQFADALPSPTTLEDWTSRAEDLRGEIFAAAVEMEKFGQLGLELSELRLLGTGDVLQELRATLPEFADLFARGDFRTALVEDFDEAMAMIERAWLDKSIDIGTLEAELSIAEAEIKKLTAAELKAERMSAVGEGIEVGAGATLALFQGDVGGAAGGVAAAAGASPIVGGIIAGINTLAEIGQMTVNEVKQNTRAFVDNLSNGFRVLAQALPEVIQILLRNLPAALIESSFTWIPLLVAELPLAIMRGVVDGIKSILGLIGEAIRNAFSLRGQDGERRFSFGAVEPPSFAVGTAKVNRTGMALIHRGETIIPAGGRESQTQAARMGAGAVNINISTAILDRDVVPRLVREIDRVTGSLGRTRANFAGT